MSHYETFYNLHKREQPFIIANAWNAKSAQIIEAAGFEAVATSSGAISASMGYADNEQMPFSELCYVLKRIKASINIPLTVDFEKGYTNDLDELIQHVQQLIELGVVGINIEDSQGEDLYLKKVASLKNYLIKNNLELFINARTDAFIQKLDSPLETVMNRAKLYEEAGADGLFVPGIQDPHLIKEITLSTTLPVNIVGTPSLNTAQAIGDTGVKRISMAVFLYRSAYNHLEKVATDIQTEKSLRPLF